MNQKPNPLFTPKFGTKAGGTTASQALQPSVKQIQAPPYLTKGAVLYHATTKKHADNIVAKGIDPETKGNVNALGRGFYTVHDLSKVWQWMHPDETMLASLKDHEKRMDYMSEHHSVIKIEIVSVPTKIWNGSNDEAEVIVREGDIVWTKNGIKHVKVIGQIHGKEMISNGEFQEWYKDSFVE